jgi:hypothetical protein
MHLYDFNTPLLLTILKALQEHFPHWQVYTVAQGSSDIVIVAWRGTPRAMDWSRLAGMPSFRADLDFLGVDAETFGLRNYVFSGRTLAPLLDSVAPNSDFVPLVENGAEKAFFLDTRVDLLEPFTDNRVFYQEVLEPEAFAPALERIRAARAAQPFDTASARMLLARLAQAGDTTDWDWLDSAFFCTAYDYAGTPAWRGVELVDRYRDIVYAGVPPRKVQDRFRLIDFASRGMHEQAAEVVSTMLYTYPRSEAGATLITTMAVEALRSGNAELFSSVYEIFARGNTELTATERRLLSALRTRAVGAPGTTPPLAP